eukprot:6117934-Amphidinium_carterae.1
MGHDKLQDMGDDFSSQVSSRGICGCLGVRVTSEGCQRILADPSGAAFPWDSPGIEVQEKDEVTICRTSHPIKYSPNN